LAFPLVILVRVDYIRVLGFFVEGLAAGVIAAGVVTGGP
jgi:hypothetical protein